MCPVLNEIIESPKVLDESQMWLTEEVPASTTPRSMLIGKRGVI